MIYLPLDDLTESVKCGGILCLVALMSEMLRF